MDYPRDFLERYHPLERLGTGGMGYVVKARQLALDRDVVVKFLQPQWRSNDSVRRRFLNEARICARLSHPNLVPVFEVDAEARWIVFGWVEGEPVSRELGRVGRMEPGRAVKLVQEAALGVEHAHSQDVIHRDLKPDNLLVAADGVVKVLDFGIASARTQLGKQTGEGTIVGTPGYMSPEQVAGLEVTVATDIYGLGATLYDLVTGRPPFSGEDLAQVLRSIADEPPVAPRQLVRELPERLERLLLKALEKDPARRHKSVASFRRALEQSLVLGAGLDVSGAGELQGPARLTAPPTLASERVPLSSVRGAAPTVAMGQTQGPATMLSGRHERAAGALPAARASSRRAQLALAVGLVAAVLVGALALRRDPVVKNDTLASTAPVAPSSPVRAPAAAADPLHVLVRRLSRGELSERRRVIRDLATAQGRWVVPALCLRFTGGAHPVTGEPVERELEPLLRLEILQALKARRDGSAVLPILLVLKKERDLGVSAAAAETVRVLGDFDRTLRPELALEWSRLELWLRQPFGTLYEWKHGVVGPGTAMTNVQTDAEPGLDILRRKWQIAVGKFAMEYFGGREGRRLMLDGISARPQSLSAWRDIAYQLFYKSRRLIDAAKIANFCWTCLPRWSEWYPPVCGKAAARAELPGIAYWLGVRSMMPTRLAPWFLAVYNAYVVPGARAIGDGAALADVAERMARELPEDPRPWMDVALFALQWGQSPELEGLIRQYMTAPNGCFWSDAAGYFHAVLARDPVALEERARAAGRLSPEKRARAEPLIQQARALSEALGGRAAAVDELDARHSTLTDAPVLLWMARIYQVSGYPKAALECLGRAVKASNLIRPAPDGTPNQLSFDESGGRPIYRLWCCLQREVGDVGGAVMTAGALVQENVPDFERYTPLLEAIRGTGPAIAPWLPTVGAMLGASSRPWAVLVRAAALLEAGQRQEAARALAQAREGFVERGGFEPAHLLALEARVAEDTGRTTEAALFWATAAAAPDAFPGEALRARARAAELTGDREAAAGYLRRAMTLDPGDWDALLSIADQTRAAENPQAAAPIYARAAVLARLSSHPAAVTIAARRAKTRR